MTFSCCQENRKAAVLGNPTLNGIDYLEVIDHAAKALAPHTRQRTLLVTCLKTAPANLTPNNVDITGGESITGITALWIAPASAVPVPPATSGEANYFAALPNFANILVVRLSEWGDFSPYTFRLVNDASAAAQDIFDVTEVLTGFDPQLAEVTFSFKVECGPEFDCAPAPPNCPPDVPTPPPINYLAKDFLSFKQVMTDRMNQLLNPWNPASEADVGVMLVEIVSHAGDRLSYRQDAVTTEAYLPTARSRISLRRHARLVDYQVHEGCNARVWMQISVLAPVFIDHTKTRFYTSAPGMPASLEVGVGNEQAALIAGVVAYEPMEDADLYPEINMILFYTWGDTNCCLPQGATEATLQGTLTNLQPGAVLIFQEVLGPQTGVAADADIRHRCAVRLTAVTRQNAAGQTLVDPLFDTTGAPITATTMNPPMPVTEIQWSSADALPFPVCVSSVFVDSNGGQTPVPNVSVVFGNVVLADQGLTMPAIQLPVVPGPALYYPPNMAGNRCQPSPRTPFPVRYRPVLPQSPVTQAVPLPLTGSPATPNAVPLQASGFVSLKDNNGFVSMTVAANAPLTWPQYFSVKASVNTANAAEFDLAVLYHPTGGGAPLALEQFTGMSTTAGGANFATTMLAESQFVQVASIAAANVPVGAVTLPNSGTVTLNDAGGAACLNLETTNPLSWTPLFSVITQVQILTPDVFNLLLLYLPSSGPAGVKLPVIIEQVNGISLENAATQLAAVSNLITIKTFEEGPNPSLSATALMNFDATQAVPEVTLTTPVEGETQTWTAAQDLLGDGPDDRNFVVEVDTDWSAHLRFGDGANGKMPPQGTIFTATYRIGNGTAGNVGAGSLTNYSAGVVADSKIISCMNPLPASGGIDPETSAQIRRRAPAAFMTQERAVTVQDYVNVTEQNPQIEEAAASLRWTGSWYTVFITAEPQNNANLSPALRGALTQTVNSYRLAGQDILIEPPDYVSLYIVLSVCVQPNYVRLNVEKALLQALGSGTLPNGQPAVFAPQNFKLGQTVYLSPIYTAARAVPGVQTVRATAFEPQGESTKVYLRQGFIPMGAFQVARMENDPSLPNHGQLKLTMQGGI